MLHWILCRLGWTNCYIEHRGAWQYSECLTCGRRWADNIHGRAGPRDDGWIETGVWTPPPDFPRMPPMPQREEDGNGSDEEPRA